jgi:hypothetical protein
MSGLALLMILSTAHLPAGAPPGSPSEASAALSTLDFSVGGTGPLSGLAGSGVSAEIGAGDGAADDIFVTPYPPVPSTNVKILDDGGPAVGFFPGPPFDLTIRTAGPDTGDVDSYAIPNTNGVDGSVTPLIVSPPASLAGTEVQFSVDAFAGGIPGAPPRRLLRGPRPRGPW